MKKALIFDPYLDTLGGGERYVLSFAGTLADFGFDVHLAWPDPDILREAGNRFGQEYSKITTSKSAFISCTQKQSLFKKYLFQKDFDLIFWVSDGSLPFLFGKNNLLHLQVPFSNLGNKDLLFFLKKIFISKFVCNSIFTKNVYSGHLPERKLSVLYPPVDTAKMKEDKKEKWIISVARFDSPLHQKRQDVLIGAFKLLHQKISGYKLLLLGGSMSNNAILKLEKKAKGLPVKFVINPSFAKLRKYYSKSQFFWHAAGFEIDEKKNPEAVEHFGITTVEAMSSGCVPVVIKKGGQKEIVSHGLNGFLCDDMSQLAEYTYSLINNPKTLYKVKTQAKIDSTVYSLENFKKSVEQLVK